MIYIIHQNHLFMRNQICRLLYKCTNSQICIYKVDINKIDCKTSTIYYFKSVYLVLLNLYKCCATSCKKTKMENFITEIKINSSRNIRYFIIPLSKEKRQHLIITGKNGSDKTSLLIELNKYLTQIDNVQFQNYQPWTT